MPKQARESKRTATACVACRRSKIKCSGELPCQNCNRRGTGCYFSDSNTKILVSERYFRDLQNYVRSGLNGRFRGASDPGEQHNNDHPTSTCNGKTSLSEPAGYETGHAPEETESMLSIWTSPFTLPSTVIKDRATTKRNWLWLAPTAPWSFVARLAVMMSEKLNLDSRETPKFHLDGDIYPLDWINLPIIQEHYSAVPLPSVDQALHAYNTVQFYLGQIYRLLDEDFPAQIRHFYERRAAGEVVYSRMWFIQLLLVLAFGKAFSLKTKTDGDPAGSKMFLRAMSLMPNHTFTGKESLVVIETLTLISLYLYSIDHREGAHSHIGQAIRLAQLEGLHTQLPENELGHATVTRCRNIWWTLYIIDRQISAALGIPMTVQDFDISTLVNVPGETPQNATLSLQVRLSQMMSSVLSRIFKTEKTQLGRFLDLTREILQTMACLAGEIEDAFPTGLHASMDTMSHEMRHVILLYHQCVIIATRPLLLSVLKERVEKLDRPEEEWHKFLVLPRILVAIGIKSADKTLEILSDENIILETFLPFDLEFAFSAALHLTIAHTLFQFDDASAKHHTDTAHQILDQLISCGNRVAEVRKTELVHMQSLFHEFSIRVKQQGMQSLKLASTPENQASCGMNLGLVPDGPGHAHAHEQGPVQGPTQGPGQMDISRASSAKLEWPTISEEDTESMEIAQDPDPLIQSTDCLEAIGISSNEFLAIVDQISTQDLGYKMWEPQPEWMAGGHIMSQSEFDL